MIKKITGKMCNLEKSQILSKYFYFGTMGKRKEDVKINVAYNTILHALMTLLFKFSFIQQNLLIIQSDSK